MNVAVHQVLSEPASEKHDQKLLVHQVHRFSYSHCTTTVLLNTGSNGEKILILPGPGGLATPQANFGVKTNLTKVGQESNFVFRN